MTRQHQALRWTFLGSGMTHANFLSTQERLSPALRNASNRSRRPFVERAEVARWAAGNAAFLRRDIYGSHSHDRLNRSSAPIPKGRESNQLTGGWVDYLPSPTNTNPA